MGGLTPYTFNVGGDPPSLPTNVEVDPNQGRPTIIWDDDLNATHFQVYVGNSSIGTLYNEMLEKTDLCDGLVCTLTPDIDPVAGIYKVWLRGLGTRWL